MTVKNYFVCNQQLDIILYEILLPLDRCGWFGADVVAYAVHALDVANDVVADFGEELVRQLGPVGGHRI